MGSSISTRFSDAKQPTKPTSRSCPAICSRHCSSRRWSNWSRSTPASTWPLGRCRCAATDMPVVLDGASVRSAQLCSRRSRDQIRGAPTPSRYRPAKAVRFVWNTATDAIFNSLRRAYRRPTENHRGREVRDVRTQLGKNRQHPHRGLGDRHTAVARQRHRRNPDHLDAVAVRAAVGLAGRCDDHRFVPAGRELVGDLPHRIDNPVHSRRERLSCNEGYPHIPNDRVGVRRHGVPDTTTR